MTFYPAFLKTLKVPFSHAFHKMWMRALSFLAFQRSQRQELVSRSALYHGPTKQKQKAKLVHPFHLQLPLHPRKHLIVCNTCQPSEHSKMSFHIHAGYLLICISFCIFHLACFKCSPRTQLFSIISIRRSNSKNKNIFAVTHIQKTNFPLFLCV